MSGWFLFFTFTAIVCMPTPTSVEAKSARMALVVLSTLLPWALVVLGLVAATLRTGGFL